MEVPPASTVTLLRSSGGGMAAHTHASSVPLGENVMTVTDRADGINVAIRILHTCNLPLVDHVNLLTRHATVF